MLENCPNVDLCLDLVVCSAANKSGSRFENFEFGPAIRTSANFEEIGGNLPLSFSQLLAEDVCPFLCKSVCPFLRNSLRPFLCKFLSADSESRSRFLNLFLDWSLADPPLWYFLCSLFPSTSAPLPCLCLFASSALLGRPFPPFARFSFSWSFLDLPFLSPAISGS